MNYIDGFVTAVPVANKEAYVKHSALASVVFKEFGALRHVEAWGDDVPEGKLTSFSMAVKREESEVVVFSWIEWPSKAARDAGWEKAMSDSRINTPIAPIPFDAKRIIYGGFQIIMEK